MIRPASLRNYDFLLLLSSGALIAFGALLIYSGTLSQSDGGFGSTGHPLARQMVFAALGGCALFVASQTDYRIYARFIIPLYLVGLLFLASVLVFGEETQGSRRWISLGGTQVQPSEMMKVIVVLALAKYLADRRERIHTVSVFVTSLAIASPAILLVLLEPDLGSAIVFGALWLGMVIVAGANLRHVGVLLAFILLTLPFAFLVLTDYQRERIALFFDPGSDPLGGGFNIIQAEIGIGSGGLLGKGLTNGLQTQNDLISSQTTDYIFSIAGEELGFVGALALLGLFTLFLFRGVKAAATAQDGFGEFVAVGIVVMVLAQVFINIAVNVRILPVTGLPLPFISQGGSSLVTLLIAVGIMQSIRLRQRRREL